MWIKMQQQIFPPKLFINDYNIYFVLFDTPYFADLNLQI